MSQSYVLPEAQTLQERPTCELCGSRMWLTRIEPGGEDHERRIFECPVCKQAEAKVIKLR
jgi:transcriptional regulator NrdR family protein